MSKTSVGTRRFSHAENTYADNHSQAIEGLHSGTGSSVWNPSKVLSALRNLARWQSRRSLLNHRTGLYCPICQAVQPVIDYKPLANLAVLSCRNDRKIDTMSDTEYAELVSRASGLKIQRNAIIGGHEVIEEGKS
jgi:hypothetical protein